MIMNRPRKTCKSIHILQQREANIIMRDRKNRSQKKKKRDRDREILRWNSYPPPTGFLLSLLQLRPAATPIDRDPAAPIPPLGHLFTTSAQHSTHKKESTTRWLCASPYGIGMYLSGERFLLISLEPCLSSRFLEQSEMQSIRDKKKSVGESDQIAASSRGAGGGSGGFN